MKKIYISLLCIAGIFNLMEAQEFPAELASSLQSVLDANISNTANKGVAATVIFTDDTEWTGSSGIIYISSAIDTSKIFDFGGQRNELVSVAVLKLQEEGLLSLDDSIGKYLNGIENLNTGMPIRRFLNQTSGIGEYWIGTNPFWNQVFSDRNKIWTLDGASEFIPQGSTETDPAFEARNSNHLVLALLVEAVTDQPVGEVIKNKLLIPLGLSSSVFPVSEFNENLLNGVWQYNGEGSSSLSGVSQDSYLTSRVSWCSKIQENARFTRALNKGEILNESNTEFLYIEAPESEEIVDYPRAGIRTSYGNGIHMMSFDGKSIAGHSGNSLNTSFSYHFLDENFTISLVSNAFNSQVPTAALFDELYAEVDAYILSGISSKNKTEAYDLRIYPNPASDFIHLSFRAGDVNNASVNIFDISGRVVLTITHIDNFSDGIIRVPLSSELREGYYFLKLNTGNEFLSKSFIIKR